MATTPPPPPPWPNPGGRKNEIYGTARPNAETPTAPTRMAFMAFLLGISGTKTSPGPDSIFIDLAIFGLDESLTGEKP